MGWVIGVGFWWAGFGVFRFGFEFGDWFLVAGTAIVVVCGF